jgi:hypothetical protein
MKPADQVVERRALESAVSNSLYLRGLGLVPLGVIFIVAALTTWKVGPLRHLWVANIAILAPLPLTFWINRYYEQHYGHVTPSTRHWVRVGVHIAAFVALAIGVWVLIARSDLPLNVFATVAGLGMLMLSAVTVGLRRHRVIIWGSLLLAGLLPIWNDDADASAVAWLLAGAAYIATGIFDHRLLVRIFGDSADRSLETRDAGA